MGKPVTLGERMKLYEHQTRLTLPRRTYTLVRVDGRAFHSFTRGMDRPFDTGLVEDMDATALALCQGMAGSVLAYVQSDEISVLLTDFENHGTEPWMGGVLQKVCSLSASIATATFNMEQILQKRKPRADAHFDSRVWTITDPNEVVNYFIWRQRDCVKNSITMAAQTVASHNELSGLNSNERQELLFKRGVNWNDYPDGHKRGRVICKRTYLSADMETTRSEWTTVPAPHFAFDPNNWLVKQIPRMPALPEEET